ncbi:hypothetical protein JZ751_029360 [Albula glossodonta]|uniref:Uncharacterized protein n=1 Tax=Albula glossodonta TaxID=121402 RepID=A0A8T2PHE5_9TELE|nr:hypothetical protein JZ751_029360 [Albula glossodonta]
MMLYKRHRKNRTVWSGHHGDSELHERQDRHVIYLRHPRPRPRPLQVPFILEVIPLGYQTPRPWQLTAGNERERERRGSEGVRGGEKSWVGGCYKYQRSET